MSIANAAVETARKEAQTAWVKSILTGTENSLVIVPVFIQNKKTKAWEPSDEFIRVSKTNPANGALLLAGFSTGSAPKWLSSKFDEGNNFVSYCTLSSSVDKLEAKYQAAQILEGRIDTAYDIQPSNPNDLDQDVWYVNRACMDAGIPCEDENGNTYYQHRYWERDINTPAPIQPKEARITALAKLTA